MTPPRPSATLADLRREIDRIDDAMHRLLIERGEVIERLIAVKGTAQSGAAFRPEREASQMRTLAERHRGLLPLDTPEGIWRVIIGSFIHVQAPFTIHGDASAGHAPIRDSARFHFGFTPAYREHPDPRSVIEAVAGSRGDLGLVPIEAEGLAWWRGLEGEGRPKVIARLPFIERSGHPAGLPVFVVSNPIEGAGGRDSLLYSVRKDGLDKSALEALGGEVVASADRGGSLLIAVPGEAKPGDIARALGTGEFTGVGAHPARFRHSG
jgi:chorismate mutase